MDKRMAQLLMRRLDDTTHHYRDLAHRLLSLEDKREVVIIDRTLYVEVLNALHRDAFPPNETAEAFREDDDDNG